MSLTVEENLKDSRSSTGSNSEEPKSIQNIKQPAYASINQENEVQLVKMYAKLFRFDYTYREWKERGVGEIQLLHNIVENYVRIVMRRDKIYKICANHFVTPDIEMIPHQGSKKAFLWSAFADYSDGKINSEIFVVKFHSNEDGNLWKIKYAEAQQLLRTQNAQDQ